jgi:NAD(P)-dependent dehydrogenase (short-subunit alcohol dehydrogenase family)
MLESCRQHFGRIDILINNAAAYFKTPLLNATEEDWDRLIDVNLKAPFFCAKLAAGYMKEQGSGQIINISDVAAYNPWVDYLPYCISKAGVATLTRGLAKELAPEIQVNAVAPGTVLMSEDASEDYTSAIRERTLLKRIGQPRDIANTILFLLEGSDYITGAVIPVDGGSSLV